MNNSYSFPTDAGPIYKLYELTKKYDRRVILNIGSLEIERGEIFAVVGPSGAGKSTLLRIMNFLEAPSTGTLEIGGLTLGNGAEPPLGLKRKVTMLFQRPMLLERSVWDNVAFGLHLRGERNIDKKVRAALEEVGLTHLSRQRARTLSGGEAQRVALARAIVLNPDVLLLDEPTANLDPYNVTLIENIARRINQENHTTLVLVTHNIFQAKRLATRVAFMLEGNIVEVAGMQTFFESPTDPRTSAFVRGEMVY
jgi:tungstate transport system ATP-binding protein